MIEDQKLSFLYASLKEAQDNIRTYDTKAQIVGIGYIFTFGAMTKLSDSATLIYQSNLLNISVLWALIVFPLIAFVSVLYPTRKMAPSVIRGREVVKALFYLHPWEIDSVNEYVKQLKDMDLEQELSYELFKVSVLRDLKRKRFLKAILLSSLGLSVLFAIQVYPNL